MVVLIGLPISVGPSRALTSSYLARMIASVCFFCPQLIVMTTHRSVMIRSFWVNAIPSYRIRGDFYM